MELVNPAAKGGHKKWKELLQLKDHSGNRQHKRHRRSISSGGVSTCRNNGNGNNNRRRKRSSSLNEEFVLEQPFRDGVSVHDFISSKNDTLVLCSSSVPNRREKVARCELCTGTNYTTVLTDVLTIFQNSTFFNFDEIVAAFLKLPRASSICILHAHESDLHGYVLGKEKFTLTKDINILSKDRVSALMASMLDFRSFSGEVVLIAIDTLSICWCIHTFDIEHNYFSFISTGLECIHLLGLENTLLHSLCLFRDTPIPICIAQHMYSVLSEARFTSLSFYTVLDNLKRKGLLLPYNSDSFPDSVFDSKLVIISPFIANVPHFCFLDEAMAISICCHTLEQCSTGHELLTYKQHLVEVLTERLGRMYRYVTDREEKQICDTVRDRLNELHLSIAQCLQEKDV